MRPDDDWPVLAGVAADDIRAIVIAARMRIHPAMVPLHQPQADGVGFWTAGGVAAVLRDVAMEGDFLRAFGLMGLDALLGIDLDNVPLTVPPQDKITQWMLAHGWHPAWTWAAICRVGTLIGMPEADLSPMFKLPWPDAWSGPIPRNEWDRISQTFLAQGWHDPWASFSPACPDGKGPSPRFCRPDGQAPA